MYALIQRVRLASVVIEGHEQGRIERGILLFLCAEHGDTEAQADRLLTKTLKLRIFSDEAGRMNRSLQDVSGGLLIVSQFTLAADARHGNRPGFSAAAPPALGEALYDYFVQQAQALHAPVATGQFGADMQVHLVNDGPVTIPIRIQPVCSKS